MSADDLAPMWRIDQMHLEHPFMGARMPRDHLHREGMKAGPYDSLSALPGQPGYMAYTSIFAKSHIL